MNVAKGDLAIIIGTSMNAGCIGEVMKFYGNIHNKSTGKSMLRVWMLQFSRPLKGTNLSSGENQECNYLLVEDAILRKITGPNILFKKNTENESEYEN